MTQFAIRHANPSDAPAFTECIDAAYAQYREQGIALPLVSEGIEDDIASNIVWVAEKDSAIIGGLILVVSDTSAKLANIAVHPSAGGMGVGRGLIDVCEAHVLGLGFSELHLATHKDMPDNVTLYEHLGWRVTGAEGDKIFMTKAIA